MTKGSGSLLAYPKVSHSPDALTSTANGTPQHQTLAKVAGNVDKLSLTDLVLAANRGWRLPVSGVSVSKWLPMAAVAEHGTDTSPGLSPWLGENSRA